MSIQLIEMKDKKQLDDFVGTQEHAELLQSWEWGEFLSRADGEIRRFGVEENGVLAAVITLVKRPLFLGMNYFYAPRGPISKCEVLEFLLGEIKKIAEKEKVIFLRIEPREKINNPSFIIYNSLDIQVSKTIILDLTKSEEELLAAMHQKTRYNIRLAEKKGVKIREAGIETPLLSKEGFEGGFEKFWSLMSATVNRDGFRLHEKEYYQKMLATENIKLYFGFVPRSFSGGGDLIKVSGEQEEKIICAGIFSFFGDTAVYLHGASSNENREVMAPYLLQWELIKKAKAAGCKYYDFSGIDEKKWPGVTRFKRGFSGEEINYPGTFDVIFSQTLYKFYNFLRIIIRLIRIR
jgi:peptidoglycan pentaglycine glycine transferase (the first glycine)